MLITKTSSGQNMKRVDLNAKTPAELLNMFDCGRDCGTPNDVINELARRATVDDAELGEHSRLERWIEHKRSHGMHSFTLMEMGSVISTGENADEDSAQTWVSCSSVQGSSSARAR